MTTATKQVLISASVAAFLAAPLTAQITPPSALKPDFSGVRKLIAAEIGPTSTPSLSVAVARGNEIIWEEGFGWSDRAGGTAATPDTLYYTASVAKTITATALMILHERKQLDLDRPANQYLKSAKLRSPRWNPDEATVRRVATHTAGLTTYDSAQQIPAAETIRRYGVLFWRPALRFDYSNLGFGVLGQIIADVSGRSFQSFVHDEVLRPLAMPNAWAGATPASRHPVAQRYSAQLRDFSPPLSEPTLPGASVMYCSAHELALFGMFHLKARHAAQKAVLSDAGIDALQRPEVTVGDAHQGLGWRITDNQHGYRTLLSQGGTFDSQAWLMLVPSERLTIVVLSNTGMTPAPQLIDEILSSLLPAYRENLAKAAAAAANEPVSPAAATNTIPPEIAGAWIGEVQTYRGNVPLRFEIKSDGGIAATLGKQAPVMLTNVRAAADRLAGRMIADLGVEYGGAKPYEVRFSLDRDGDKFIGAAVTYALPGTDGPRLPFWVDLSRAR